MREVKDEFKTILFYRKNPRGVEDTLLRKINVKIFFNPSRDWMNSIEPTATYFT
jgi:hypothetical protein